jgi:hypothetical protein
MSKERKNCMCTAMLYEPPKVEQKQQDTPKREGLDFKKKSKLYERWMKFKQYLLLRNQPPRSEKLEFRVGKLKLRF